MKHNKIEKEPGLLRQIIEIHYEQAKRRKALRILSKQVWSVEFFEYLIKKAAKTLHQNIQIELESPAGHKMRMTAVYGEESSLSADDDIFNHLDDAAAVNNFIRMNSTRGVKK